MSQVRTFEPKNRLKRLLAQSGGLTFEEAVRGAEFHVDMVHDREWRKSTGWRSA
jgi:hypothetical protein